MSSESLRQVKLEKIENSSVYLKTGNTEENKADAAINAAGVLVAAMALILGAADIYAKNTDNLAIDAFIAGLFLYGLAMMNKNTPNNNI